MDDPIILSPNQDRNWQNDHLQFARLIAEACTVGNLKINKELLDALVLEQKDVHAIIERAQNAWELAKANSGYWFQEGDWMWWEDPDEGACSGFGVVHILTPDHVILRRFSGLGFPTPYIESSWPFHDCEVCYHELTPAYQKMKLDQVGRYRIDEQGTKGIPYGKVHVKLRHPNEYAKH